jgi:hypothetical protein
MYYRYFLHPAPCSRHSPQKLKASVHGEQNCRCRICDFDCEMLFDFAIKFVDNSLSYSTRKGALEERRKHRNRLVDILRDVVQ